MSEVTLEGLRVCREIALLGSFSAAGRSLGYSQPSISRQVAALEDAVGCELFVREVRGVTVTASGALMVEHANRILAGVTALRHDLQALDDGLAGRVAVGAFPAAMSVLVPRAVARLGADHPGLLITLTEASTPALLRELRDGRLQVVVIGVGSELPEYDLAGLATQQVRTGDLCIAVADVHRLAQSGRVSVRELTDEPWIAGTGSPGDPQFAAWPTLPDANIRFRVRSWPARLGLVAAGLGICLLPAITARSVPDGVAVLGVDDPLWLGRRTLAVTKPGPSEPIAAVLAALHNAADEV